MLDDQPDIGEANTVTAAISNMKREAIDFSAFTAGNSMQDNKPCGKKPAKYPKKRASKYVGIF